ncbi:MAG TPA: DUF2243 domain-containing protein [Sphingomonas sp.]|jgi:uncharacterized membrane protein|uniref:DUF2243 domain-containing protein n=1 Tax=Sphingomonas sp. TaxID=28214 RepID=UPI002ED7DA58
MQGHPPTRRDFRGTTIAAFVIGLALSGFFDGILLHQVLQWHHFLSLVPGETYRDLRTQIYADGLFHVAVYAIACIGLALLWRARRQLDRPGARSHLIGGVLLGFGVWNVVDVGFFHWILGIHRIRVNVPNPMIYDIGWIVGLGLAVMLMGWWILHRGGPAGPATRRPDGRPTAATMVVLLGLAVPVANIPSANGATLIVFRTDAGPAAAINAIRAVEGRIVMLDPEGAFAVVDLAKGRSTRALYRAGAIFVTRSPALAGCLAFTDAVR